MQRPESIRFKYLTFLILAGFFLYSCNKIEQYKNPKLSIEKRVDDLVSRLTLDEKISQMMDIADSIPRLGIPSYNWWNEGLHGVARAGVATVFPQAIGLSATFNDSLMFEIASVISDEFRAKYNDFQLKGERDRYKGLTVWSPNINIFRDPRWGRGQETYGEDPFLTARMGVNFVKGMQGDHEKYLKTIATPKHYVVHSGPESLRHVFNAEIGQRDFIDTYLPAFEACIKEGKAKSVMGAYNRLRGESCCGSPHLLTTIIRDNWGFDGYVVSDCGAVYDIFGGHHIASSEAEAAAIAVKSGCDLNCGDTYRNLKEAVERGLISESQIDVSLKRLLNARFRLGMFDPPGSVPYDTIPYSINDCKAHRDISAEAARQSIVLLKNEADLLPLPKDIGTVAVIGPNADDPEVMYGNYNGTPSSSVTPLQGIRKEVAPETEVLYSRGCNLHHDLPKRITINEQYLTSQGKPGLTGEYYSNKELNGSPVLVRTDNFIDYFWFDDTPAPEISRENFSIRWKGNLIAPISGHYELRVSGDDGFRLFIDGQLVLDKWQLQAMAGHSVFMNFVEGSEHSIVLEYYQEHGIAGIKFEWALPEEDIEKEALEMAGKADMIVFVGGLSPKLEGEEMRVDLSGFQGGDRTILDLPVSQQNLLQKLKATGKPIILVLMNGSALSINWADENIPSIIEAWYPGQEGGTAIADIIFGDYNPAGRLPVTFYKSIDQLPPFGEYNMKGRTYRYFEGEPLYPFGYGLSYTFFNYSAFEVPAAITTTDSIIIHISVTNTGNYDGDEVVQVYLKHLDASVPVPVHALQGYKRIHLHKGEKKSITFKLSPIQLAVIDDKDQRVVIPGTIQVFVGGQQPNRSNIRQGKVLMKEIEITGEKNVIDRISR